MKKAKTRYLLSQLDEFDDFLTQLPASADDYVVDHAAFFSTRGQLIRARLDAGYTMSFLYSAFSRIFPQKISQKQFEFFFSRYYNPGAANEQPLALEPGRQKGRRSKPRQEGSQGEKTTRRKGQPLGQSGPRERGQPRCR
jgi:hypothetical protein